jgi:hypothetical protein
VNDGICGKRLITDEPFLFVLLLTCFTKIKEKYTARLETAKLAAGAPVRLTALVVRIPAIYYSNSPLPIPHFLLDCCDGSDEYGSNGTCKNTCWEAGKAAREKLKKKVATYKSGVVIRNQEVEKAKVALAKDEAELAKLKGEEKILQGLVDKLKGELLVATGPSLKRDMFSKCCLRC